jgi:hypothetical protein
LQRGKRKVLLADNLLALAIEKLDFRAIWVLAFQSDAAKFLLALQSAGSRHKFSQFVLFSCF